MTQRTIAKFYRDVSVAERENCFVVLLDGKPVKTPSRLLLALPARTLADAVAEEWRAQREKIDPATMPLTALANTAIDRLPSQRDAVVTNVLRHARSDVLCYRAESPADLAALQAAAWDPLLDWAAETHGARLAVGSGVAFVEQPEASLDALGAALERCDDFVLAAVSVAAALTGSLVLALALADRRLDARDVFAAANIDEVYQAERWGLDAEAEVRRSRVAAELAAAETFLNMLAA